LQTLLQAALDLNAQGITDRSKMQASLVQAATPASRSDKGLSQSEMTAQLARLRRAFDAVQAQADRGEPREAAGLLVSAYFEAFEPIETTLNARNPSAVRPLETRFAALRSAVDSGLKGEELRQELTFLQASAAAALQEATGGISSAFGIAFAASLGTALREGVEVILLLSMLVALVAKSGRPRGAMAALWWGVGLAVVASGATAIGLNMVVSGARGRSRELLEAGVMLAASGVLFYVSYWLISQSESKRWMDFLKRQAHEGAAMGGFFTLGLTAFLAVFREGAETALMYQAMLSNQPPQGLLGIASGLAVGLVLLGLFALVLRATSVKLPMRRFFQVTGMLLFALSVIFAGNAVLELQVAGILKTTPLGWMGAGVPLLGVHPTAQGVAIQGLLLLGAVLAFVTIRLNSPKSASRQEPRAETMPASSDAVTADEPVSARA
jgi:high-affinity iron transporter